MEAERSLQLATWPHPETNQTNPLRFTLINSSHVSILNFQLISHTSALHVFPISTSPVW